MPAAKTVPALSASMPCISQNSPAMMPANANAGAYSTSKANPVSTPMTPPRRMPPPFDAHIVAKNAAMQAIEKPNSWKSRSAYTTDKSNM